MHTRHLKIDADVFTVPVKLWYIVKRYMQRYEQHKQRIIDLTVEVARLKEQIDQLKEQG